MKSYVMTKLHVLIDHIVYAFAFIVIFFREIELILTGVLLLICLDQITGSWKAIKNKKFKWHEFNKLYTKLILYNFAVIGMFILEKLILRSESHYFTKGIATVIAFHELASSYLNMTDIVGKDYLRDYLNKVSPFLEKEEQSRIKAKSKSDRKEKKV